jgi:PKD repeat protein
MAAPASRWVLRAGATKLAEGDAAVPANGGTPISVNVTVPAAGSYPLRARADSLGVVFETSETNNASVRTLTVNPVPGNTAPVAVATGVPQSGQAPLTVNFSGASSTDANGDSLTYSWAFGDGGTATGRLASRTYAAGTYAAILTVNDGRGGTDTASVAITATSPPPPPGGFPQTAVLDNFNRANGAIGSSWRDQTSAFRIASNVLSPTGNSDSYVEWNGSFGANQEAFVTLSTVQATGLEHNLMLKTQGNSWSGGHIEVTFGGPTNSVRVITLQPPSTWVTRATFTGVPFASGDQLGARALADGTVQVYKNGAQIGTTSVTGWPYYAQGGRIGISVGRAASARFDNFGGGNYVAPVLALSETVAEASSGSVPRGTLALSNAFPNPTTGGVSFTLTLPREESVSMSVLDIQGRTVWSQTEATYSPGTSTLRWEGRDAQGPAAAGVYLARVRVGAQVYLRRLAIVR